MGKDGAAHRLRHGVGSSPGRIYPALGRIRDLSATIATELARLACDRVSARADEPDDLLDFIRSSMFESDYPSYI